MGVFEDGMDTLFADENLSLDAQWAAGGIGSPIAVRVLLKAPDLTLHFGASRVVQPSAVIVVRTNQVTAPAAGDEVTIAGVKYEIMGAPTRGPRNLIWSCEAKFK